MTWTRIGGWAGIAASLVLSAALAAGADKASSPEHAKRQGKLSPRRGGCFLRLFSGLDQHRGDGETDRHGGAG